MVEASAAWRQDDVGLLYKKLKPVQRGLSFVKCSCLFHVRSSVAISSVRFVLSQDVFMTDALSISMRSRHNATGGCRHEQRISMISHQNHKCQSFMPSRRHVGVYDLRSCRGPG